MKGIFSPIFLFFVFVAAVIIARPCFVYGSAVVRASLEREAKAFGLSKAVRKRHEPIHTPHQYNLASESNKKAASALLAIRPFLRKQLKLILRMLSSYLSDRASATKAITSVFKRFPHNDHYKALSVFRI